MFKGGRTQGQAQQRVAHQVVKLLLMPLRLSRIALALLLLIGIRAPLWAQPLADRAPLRGIVVDESGALVSSAVLTVRRQEDNGPASFWGGEARSDDKGNFSFPKAQEGRYYLSVEAPNHAPLQNFPFVWNAQSPALRLTVRRLTRLTLHLTMPDGKALANAPVWIRTRAVDASPTTTRTSTDANGDAQIPDLAPATYSLVVVAQNGVGVLPSAPVTWAPNGARLEVPLFKGGSIRIHVLDADGKALGGASLILFPRSPEDASALGGQNADAGENWALVAAANAPQALVTRDGDGVLELSGIPAGHFSARLSLPGYGAPTRDFDALDGQTLDWEVPLPARRAASLTLSVKDGAGGSVRDSLVALRLLPLAADGTFAPDSPFGDTAPFPGATQNAPPDLPFYTSGPGGRVARTDSNGQITLYPLKAGHYRVFASRPTPDSRLRAPVAAEGAPLDVEVTLSPDGSKMAKIQVP